MALRLLWVIPGRHQQAAEKATTKLDQIHKEMEMGNQMEISRLSVEVLEDRAAPLVLYTSEEPAPREYPLTSFSASEAPGNSGTHRQDLHRK